MRFAEPQLLYFTLLAFLMYLAFLVMHKKRIYRINQMGKTEALDRFSGKKLTGHLRLEGLYISLALLFFVLAMSRPQAGSRFEPIQTVGSDMYIAVDLSESMKAEDIQPNRLHRAKIDALEVLHSLHGDRVGLIYFAGDAFVKCPLTTDYQAAAEMIKNLDPRKLTAGGTCLGCAVDVALQSLEPAVDKYAVLLILTDGENTVGSPWEAVKKAGRRGIKIFTIGTGSSEGAPIPTFNENGKTTGYKKDSRGNVVLSKLKADLLSAISSRTGGQYFQAGQQFNEVHTFLRVLSRQKKRLLETKKHIVYEDRFQLPLGAGIIFLVLYLYTAYKKKKEA
ncbi:MAG: VWA domain-containing protein [Spirochaetota bacterium]